jgi:hypothetical protein
VEASVRPSAGEAEARRGPGTDQPLGQGPRPVDDPKLSTVIAAFRRDLAAERVRGLHRLPRSREELRRLGSALTHIDSELGTANIDSVGPGDAGSLIDRLAEAGLAEDRLRSVSEALRSLFAYAVARGLLERDPIEDGGERRTGGGTLPPASAPDPWSSDDLLRPAYAALGFAVRIAKWTERLIVLAFVVVVVLLVLELS